MSASVCICGDLKAVHDAEGDYDEGTWQMHYGKCKIPDCPCEGFEEA